MMNNPVLWVLFSISLTGSAIVRAQDSLVGHYSGSDSSKKPRGIELTISSHDGEVVKGSLRLMYSRFSGGNRNPCKGDYPMEGKFREGRLVMRSTEKSGTTGECSFSFSAVQEGDKLIGTTGTRGTGTPLQLSR